MRHHALYKAVCNLDNSGLAVWCNYRDLTTQQGLKVLI